MPPQKSNPASGKRPANAHVGGYTRSDGTKVRGHSRSVHLTRIRQTAVGTASAGTVCALILLEAGFTIVASLAMVLTAVFSWLLWRASESADKNRARTKTRKRRPAPKRRRTTTRRTTNSRRR
jgi:hypothetical protein